MNLLADEGIDAPIVSRLREDGHIVTYVAEMAPGLRMMMSWRWPILRTCFF